MDKQDRDAYDVRLSDAYLTLKAARRMGDRLRIELAENAMNDLLDRFVADVTRNKGE